MEWYAKRYRRNLVDMHIADWNPEFLSQFDPETYVENLKTAHISAPMLYIQSHVGLCYWPTKSGHMHKALTGREDLMRRVMDLCHKNGMDVIAYYSLIYNNCAYEDHPDWRMIDANGHGSREGGGRYGHCCPNNMDYRAFTETQIQELCEYFDFEGIFMDMLFWPTICYCDSCRKRWEKEVGGELPRTVDWKDNRWKLFQKKRCDWMGEFAQWATDVIHRYKPKASVEHQYSPILHDWVFGVTENMCLASTYSGGDLYGGPEQQSFACKLYYGCTMNQPFEYMTSRCYPGLGEHTTTKSEDMLRQSILMTYAHHGASLIIDAIDPRGTLDHRLYERIGKLMKEAIPYERFLDWGKQVFDASIYYDLNGKYNPETAPYTVGGALDRTRPMHESALGASKSLHSHHIPYGVVNNQFFERFREGKVLILADVPEFEDSKVDTVLDFVRNGGSVYMSGHCSPRLLKEIFGLEYTGWTEESVTYISPTPEADALMGDLYTYDYPLAMMEPQPVAQGVVKGTVLGTLTLPYTLPATSRFSDTPFFADEGEHTEESHELRRRNFASIHSNPPGIHTSHPAMVMASYGKGKAFWSALSIERPDREQHSEIFARVIRALAGTGLAFNVQGPDFVECVLFDAPEHNARLFSVINTLNMFHFPEAHDITVSIPMDKIPARVLKLGDPDTEYPFIYRDSQVHIHLDVLKCFEMFLIER